MERKGVVARILSAREVRGPGVGVEGCRVRGAGALRWIPDVVSWAIARGSGEYGALPMLEGGVGCRVGCRIVGLIAAWSMARARLA